MSQECIENALQCFEEVYNLVGIIFGLFVIFLFLAITSIPYKYNEKILTKRINPSKQVPPPNKKERKID
jgi:hypothetical protein